MVQMRDCEVVEALHEPANGARTAMSERIKSKKLADKAVRAPVRRWFMVTMRGWKTVGTLHEPPPHPIPLPLGGGEGARRAGEGVVHGPNACEKRKGAFHEPAPLWRRLAICCVAGCQPAGRSDPFHARRLPIGETADYQSALLDGHG